MIDEMTCKLWKSIKPGFGLCELFLLLLAWCFIPVGGDVRKQKSTNKHETIWKVAKLYEMNKTVKKTVIVDLAWLATSPFLKNVIFHLKFWKNGTFSWKLSIYIIIAWHYISFMFFIMLKQYGGSVFKWKHWSCVLFFNDLEDFFAFFCDFSVIFQ